MPIQIDTTSRSDPASTYKFTYGQGATSVAGQPRAGVNGDWWTGRMQRFVGLQPGTYTVGQIQWVIQWWDGAGSECHFMVINDPGSGDNATELLSKNITSDMPADDATTLVTSTINDTFTVAEGDDIYIGVAFKKLDITYTTPYLHGALTNEGPDDAAHFTVSAAGTGTPTIARSVLVLDDESMWRTLELTSANHVSLERGTSASKIYGGSAKDVLIPTHGPDYQIVLRNALVTDGNALTVILKTFDATGAESTLSTFILDMGATDQVTFDGTSVALAGAAAEAGDSFDICFNVRATTIDVFYVNRSTGQGPIGNSADIATFSHTIRNSGSRATAAPTIASPNMLAFSGTANVDTIYVCRGMVVDLGDSQALAARLGDAISSGFGSRVVWDAAAISANKFATDSATTTAAYERFCSTTPGQGDLCEMTGVMNMLAGCGINDITPMTGSPTVDQQVAILDPMNVALTTLVAAMVDSDSANEMAFLGLPPIPSGDSSYSVGRNGVVQLWNEMLAAVSASMGAIWYDPYTMTQGNATYFLNGDLSNLHYSTSGASEVIASMTRSYDAGEWWAGNGSVRMALRGALVR